MPSWYKAVEFGNIFHTLHNESAAEHTSLKPHSVFFPFTFSQFFLCSSFTFHLLSLIASQAAHLLQMPQKLSAHQRSRCKSILVYYSQYSNQY